MLDAETMWDMSLFLFKKLIKLLVQVDFHNFKFSQKHLRCLGSRLVCFAAGERYGVDGQTTVGNSLGRELRWEGARW